jgi:hypothetical protein
VPKQLPRNSVTVQRQSQRSYIQSRPFLQGLSQTHESYLHNRAPAEQIAVGGSRDLMARLLGPILAELRRHEAAPSGGDTDRGGMGAQES